MEEFEEVKDFTKIPETKLYKELKKKLENGEITEDEMLKKLSGKYIARE